MNRPPIQSSCKLLIQKCYEDAKVPTKAYDTDSGFDVYAYSFKVRNVYSSQEIEFENEYLLRPRDIVLVNTGIIATAIGEDSPLYTMDRFNETYTYELQVRPRSGLAFKSGITVLNTPGTVDNAFRGQLGVILVNHSDVPFRISRGDKIAQIVPIKVELPIIEVVDKLPDADRGLNGIGSTGIK